MLVLCTLRQALLSHAYSVLLCLAYEDKALSGQIRLLLSGEHVWNGL